MTLHSSVRTCEGSALPLHTHESKCWKQWISGGKDTEPLGRRAASSWSHHAVEHQDRTAVLRLCNRKVTGRNGLATPLDDLSVLRFPSFTQELQRQARAMPCGPLHSGDRLDQLILGIFLHLHQRRNSELERHFSFSFAPTNAKEPHPIENAISCRDFPNAFLGV